MSFFEMTDAAGRVRPCYAGVQQWVEAVGVDGLRARLKEAETIFRRIGITFAVYGEGGDLLDQFGVRPRRRDQLDHRHQMRRVDRMGDQELAELIRLT